MGAWKYLLIWPLANIRLARWISAISVLGVAFAVFLVTTLQGFVSGYQQAVSRDVDGLGYDLLITARGCPYEAATLMLRGGVGLRYMPDSVLESLRADGDVAAVFPTLIHPVRDPLAPAGMTLLKGVVPEVFEARGLSLLKGEWLSAGSEGVVLGFEAAEIEQRHVGDAWLVPGGVKGEALSLPVLGVLERTGSQLDGTVLMELSALQKYFGLEDRLTGAGLQLSSGSSVAREGVRDRYESDPALQVISLDSVVETLRLAMANLHSVVGILSGFMAVLAAAVLFNTSMLRSLAEHRRLVTLHAIGIGYGFIATAALIENLILVCSGTLLGVGLSVLLGGWSDVWLGSYLPYVPSGELVQVEFRLVGMVFLGAVGLGGIATLPALARVRLGQRERGAL
ncbi:MAG: ABC transporter permease [Myxococcota bacterium]|nr:ABC transporter permease [Myxococcota bacterium]